MIYTGLIYNEAGNPLPGVSVQAYDPVAGKPFGDPTHTGAQGSWSLDVPDGKYILYFFLTGYQSYSVPAARSAELIMKPGAGYEPQPGELLPVAVSPGVKVDWKFWLLLALGIYGISKK